MSDITIREITAQDVNEFVLTITAEDKREVQIMNPDVTIRRIVESAIEGSRKSAAARIDGELVCIYGIQDIGENAGIPWMLVTNACEKHRVTFLKRMKDEFETFTKGYAEMWNYVHTKNHRAVKWLQMIGFTLEMPILLNGELFNPFWMKRHV